MNIPILFVYCSECNGERSDSMDEPICPHCQQNTIVETKYIRMDQVEHLKFKAAKRKEQE